MHAVTGSSASSEVNEGSGRSSNLLVRIVTAAIGIPIVLGINYLGGWPFAVALCLTAVVAYHEYRSMAKRVGYSPALVIGVLASGGLALSSPLVTRPQALWSAMFVATMMVSGAWFLAKPNYERGFLGWILTIGGVAYVAVLLAHIGMLRQIDQGARWVVLVFVITWAYDTGAYIAGSTVGKRPFMQHVSPSKTLEGVVGGLIASALAALIATPAVGLALWQSLLLGVAGGVAAQTGDLVESMMKRQTGVKDSGAVIPGHGGLLDRIDSLLFVGPIVYYVALVTGHGS